MKKTLIIIFIISLMAAGFSCGGGGGSSSKGSTSQLTINVGSIRTASGISAAAIPTGVGSIRFTISAPDMPTIQRTVGVTSDPIVEQFDVPNGANRHVVVEALAGAAPPIQQGTGSTSGTITNALNGSGVSGITVSLRSGENVTSGTVVATTTTASNGAYSFTGLQPGTYTAEVSGSGYVTTYFSMTVVVDTTTPNQNAVVSPLMAAGQTRIVLTWGSTPEDLDSHLTGPIAGSSSRFHVFYSDPGSQASSPFAALDLDDTTSFGPETVTIYNQTSGVYRYSVHDFTNDGSTSSSALASSGAQVKVYRDNALVATYNVPNAAGTLWTVFELNGDVITPVNSMSYATGSSTIQSAKVKKPAFRTAQAETVLYRGAAYVDLDGTPKNIIIDMAVPTFSAADYFPLNVGDTRTTSNNCTFTCHSPRNPGSGTFTEVYTDTVSGTETVNNITGYKMGDPVNGDYNLISNVNGLMMLKQYDVEGLFPGTAWSQFIFEPPVTILPSSFSIGIHITGSGLGHFSDSSGFQITGTGTVDSTVEAIEDVTVPAGTFANCIKVRWKFSRTAANGSYQQTDDVTFWLAKGVGIVKEVVTHTITLNGQADTENKTGVLTNAKVGGIIYPQVPTPYMQASLFKFLYGGRAK